MKHTIFFMLLIVANPVFSQWECRNHLASNLKPIYNNSDFLWGTGLTGSAGYINSSVIANGMAFAGIGYYRGNHELYAEGGFKYWFNRDNNSGYNFSKSMFGLRELSYSFSIPSFNVSAGLLQQNTSDYFLVNERAWGASIGKEFNDFRLNFAAATVTKDFARNGIFCTNSYLYDIVSSRNYPLGSYWGETNFASMSINKKRGGKKQEALLSSEGFDVFGPVNTDPGNKGLDLKSWGVVFYSEFGSYYAVPQFYGGLMSEIALGNFATLKTEAVYQQITGNCAALFYIQAGKEFQWPSSDISNIECTFLGKFNISEGAVAMPRFANLFYGEVFRMDVVDLPLINVSAKHRFIDQKLSLMLRYTYQFEGTNMRELDFQAGKFFLNNHLRLTVIAGLMNSTELEDWAKLARVEMRFFF